VKHSVEYHDVPKDFFQSTTRLLESYKDKISNYADQLLWWNKRLNLVSRHVSRETLNQHIFHSLLISQIPAFKKAAHIIDAGTGGGLPGIPLAITHPQKAFLLNDIVSKKIRAARDISRKLNISNISTQTSSIGEFEFTEGSLLVTKHAFKIIDLWAMVHNGHWDGILMLKGLPLEEELPTPLPFSLQVYKLDTANQTPFYKGKAIVFLQKQ